MQPSSNMISDGGHSWAGMGWDVSAPCEYRTRWGAPRYDANQEKQNRIVGEALIPNTHRAAWVEPQINSSIQEEKGFSANNP
jgi:hypothetical protein